MEREELMRAIGDMSDDLVAAAAPGTAGKGRRRGRRLRWAAAAAACVCLAAVGVWAALPRSGPGPIEPTAGPMGPVDVLGPSAPGTVDAQPSGDRVPTSDAYGSLEELLAYLSGHDDHSAENRDKLGAGGDAVRSSAGYTAVVRDGYAYHLAHEGEGRSVRISRLDASPEQVGRLDTDAELLFQWGDRLAAVGQRTEELAPDAPSWAWVELYDLSDPVRPALTGRFDLLGGLTGCWQDGEDLYLLTGDGACACGWSRLSDPEDYYPQLERDGQPVPWEETEIAVLGEPLRVEYTAAVRIDLGTGELAGKRAFYGDVDGVFHGEGWLALVTEGYAEGRATLPVTYSFADDFSCDGRLDAAALLGLSGTVKLSDGALPDGRYPELVSVSREGDVLRVLGSVRELREGGHASSLLAAAVDLSTGESGSALLPLERFYHIGDLLWEEDRALLCVTSLSEGWDKEDELCLARFDGAQAALELTGLSCDSVDGVDMMYSYGSPLGWLETVIPLGGGRYLRYNGRPDGLDLYDLSGDAPVLVRRSPGDLPEGRFEFQWEVYDEDTVGILTVWPNEDGEYRNVGFTWDVYRVEEDGLELLARHPVRGGELTALEQGGQRWLAEWDGTIAAVDW